MLGKRSCRIFGKTFDVTLLVLCKPLFFVQKLRRHRLFFAERHFQLRNQNFNQKCSQHVFCDITGKTLDVTFQIPFVQKLRRQRLFFCGTSFSTS